MHTFVTNLEWKGGEHLVQTCEGRPALDVSSPAAFGGEAGRWTPEDLLCAAMESCVLLTALYFVNRNRIGLKAWRSRTTATMEKGASGLRFTGMDIAIAASVAADDDVKKLTDAVHLAEKYCPLSAAINFPAAVSIECSVEG